MLSFIDNKISGTNFDLFWVLDISYNKYLFSKSFGNLTFLLFFKFIIFKLSKCFLFIFGILSLLIKVFNISFISILFSLILVFDEFSKFILDDF